MHCQGAELMERARIGWAGLARMGVWVRSEVEGPHSIYTLRSYQHLRPYLQPLMELSVE